MKNNLLLGLAVVFSGSFTHALADQNAANPNLPVRPAGQIYHSTNYGFELTLPAGWTATEGGFFVSHYTDGFCVINSQRPGMRVQSGWSDGPSTVQQMQPGEVYMAFAFAGGPGPTSMRADTVGDDLSKLLTNDIAKSTYETGLQQLNVSFFKRGQWWSISADLREPVSDENRQKVRSLLHSLHFVESPVGNAAWAESLAWKELPEQIRGDGSYWEGWPTGAATDQQSQAVSGQRSVEIKKAGEDYSVKFCLDGVGAWEYLVAADGTVRGKPPKVYAIGASKWQLPSDLPGASKGAADAFWVQPYVQVAQAMGGETLIWYSEDGRVRRTAPAYAPDPWSGFFSHSNIVEGINEDWSITLHKGTNDPRYAGNSYAKSTPDSRVFVHQFDSRSGMVGLDIYVHGQLVNTIGPYFPYYPSAEFTLNDDGSLAMLIARTNPAVKASPLEGAALRDHLAALHRLGAQVVVLNPNGSFQFQTDCGTNVWDPIVAPNGAGVLLRPNGGTNQNTFMWFTAQGKLRSMDIYPNPEFIGWIPGTCKSLNQTSLGGNSDAFELIDWETGTRLGIKRPGSGAVIGTGLTAKYIIFAVAEPYPMTPLPATGGALDDAEWIRTFYAVDVQTGNLVARWQAQLPHRSRDRRDHFVTLGGRLFYVTTDEFTELNLDYITAKTHGWR